MKSAYYIEPWNCNIWTSIFAESKKISKLTNSGPLLLKRIRWKLYKWWLLQYLIWKKLARILRSGSGYIKNSNILWDRLEHKSLHWILFYLYVCLIYGGFLECLIVVNVSWLCTFLPPPLLDIKILPLLTWFTVYKMAALKFCLQPFEKCQFCQYILK